VDSYGDSFFEKWFKKRESYEVIPMRMGKKQVDVPDLFFHELITQRSYAGAGVNDDQVAFAGSYFHTGRVTTVFSKLCPTHRNRSPGTPTTYVHIKNLSCVAGNFYCAGFPGLRRLFTNPVDFALFAQHLTINYNFFIGKLREKNCFGTK
jgi:hypothetical protein